MTKICSKCKSPSVTFIRYNGTHLCSDHFIQYFEKRVKKDLKKQGKTQGPAKIGVAVSGGKDSIVLLHMMHNIFSERSDVKVVCITVDEGIKGYRDKSLSYVKDNCKLLDIDFHIVSFKDLVGFTMDEIAAKKDEPGECSYCGVFRRLCLNQKAKELGVTKLATGHNLDDMAQSILMNFVNGDMKKLARLGPHVKVQPGLIPRIMPLRSIPEKENMLYAILKDFKFHDAECPYSARALRGSFRDIVDVLEYQTPGTRHGILNSYDSIKDLLLQQYPPANLSKCKNCGEPTSQEFCKVCLLKKRIS
jgi:uncharacterized protein (TIGR00269 family)